MRISAVPVGALPQLADQRRTRPPARPARLADLGRQLPVAVADRLAVLMAQDPGLAAAVSAQLPEARRASARDLAAFWTQPSAPTIDIRS